MGHNVSADRVEVVVASGFNVQGGGVVRAPPRRAVPVQGIVCGGGVYRD